MMMVQLSVITAAHQQQQLLYFSSNAPGEQGEVADGARYRLNGVPAQLQLPQLPQLAQHSGNGCEAASPLNFYADHGCCKQQLDGSRAPLQMPQLFQRSDGACTLDNLPFLLLLLLLLRSLPAFLLLCKPVLPRPLLVSLPT
jgi:hypothetical protein